MYCVKCGNKIEENEKYCSKCGNKIVSDTSSNIEQTKGDNTLPLLLGISSIVTIGAFPICIVLSILSIVYGNKYNKENPTNPSKAPLILGIVSLVLTTLLTIIVLLIVSLIFTGTDKTGDFMNNTWDKMIEEAPQTNEDSGLPF